MMMLFRCLDIVNEYYTLSGGVISKHMTDLIAITGVL